jgi:hypothetical protein
MAAYWKAARAGAILELTTLGTKMSVNWAVFWGLVALSVGLGAGCSDSGVSAAPNAADGGSAGAMDAAGGSTGTMDTMGGAAGDVDCPRLTVSECAAKKECAELEASLVSAAAAGAPGQEQPVGCVHAGACEEINIRARDPQGREWAFPNTCIPAGWLGEGGLGDD